MKPNLLKSAALALIVISASAKGTTLSPAALPAVIERVEIAAQQGKHPVVMFDLDDTLTNTRERTLRILNDFVAQPEIEASFPNESSIIKRLIAEQVQFLMADTMKSQDITDATFIQKANDFWLAHFFTNEYCALDKPTPGAAKYLHLLVRAGAKIVYLTGRDVPRMGEGTSQNLIRNRFPTDPSQAVLIMKPDPQMDDLKFKESQYATVAAMGEVVGAFENEPANINSMADAFPNAAAVILDTVHSPKPDVPEARVETVKDFKF